MNRTTRIFCATLLIAGIATTGAAAAQTGTLNTVDPQAGFSDVKRSYPDLDARYARDGNRSIASNVRLIRPGISQTEVAKLLGQPVSRSGDKTWNYNIEMPLVQNHSLVCQYKVYFGADQTVKKTVWRRPQCANLARQ